MTAELPSLRAAAKSALIDRWHPFFWISTAIFFLYLKTLTFAFTNFDDNVLVVENYWFLKDFHNIIHAFRTGVSFSGGQSFYRPLLTLSMMIDAHLGGTTPFSYHLSNILIHSAATCVLFSLFLRLGFSRIKAMFFALLFGIHPVLTQAVAWIPGRNDSLMGLFVLASFMCYVDFVEKNTPFSLLFHVLFFTLAIFTKETSFMLIPLCILYGFAYRPKKLVRGYLLRLWLSWSAIGLLWAFLRMHAEINGPASGYLTQGIQQILELPISIIQYIGKAFLPFNLSAYPIVRDTSSVYGIVSIMLIFVALILSSRRNNRNILFGSAWFLLFIIPPFFFPSQLRYEHRMYVPLFGLLLVAGEIEPFRSIPFITKFSLWGGGTLLVLFSLLTFIHSDHFSTRFDFWQHAVETSPHCAGAHSSLAIRYFEMGKKDLGLREIKKSLDLDPTDVSARVNFAIALMGDKNYAEANKQLKIAQRLQPDQEIIYYTLGLLRLREGKRAEAEVFWRKSLDYNAHYQPSLEMLKKSN